MMYMKVRLGNYIKEYSKKNKADEDIPVYSVTNTQGFCRDYFGKEVASKDKTTYKIVPQGCFAYNPSRINVGSVDWQRDEERVIVSPLYNVFSVSEELDQEYLYYYLKSDFALQRIRAVATGSVRDNLKLEMLKEFPILLPPKNDQKTIANNLDRVKRVIELRKSEIDKMDDLIKARFVEMFGNEKEFLAKAQNKVSDICKSRVGIVIQPTQYYTDEPNGVRAFRSLNVKPFYINDSDWVYFSESDNDQLCRTQVRAGDVAVVRTGANLGDCCVIPKKYDGCNAIDILLLTCNDDILPMYLVAFINYPVGKLQIINVQRGGAIKHLNLKQLENSRIYVPEMELQQQFVNFVHQVNKSKVAVQKALEKTQLLFDSLMQQYFG